MNSRSLVARRVVTVAAAAALPLGALAVAVPTPIHCPVPWTQLLPRPATCAPVPSPPVSDAKTVVWQ